MPGFLVLIMWLGSATVLHAATATWNPNPEPDIAGYILSYGTQPGQHPISVDVGKTTTWQISLSPGRYYFVLQAYNTSSQISLPTNEVIFDVPSGTNNPPTLTQPSNQTSAENASVSLQLIASDPDGNTLAYSATGLPASLSINPSTGLIAGTLTSTSAGSYTVTATVSDGALSASRTFGWTVVDVAPGPSISSLSPSSGPIGTSVTIAGSNFGTAQGSSVIRFNGTSATASSWSNTSLVTSVPTNATTGSVVVTVNGIASNAMTFTVSASSGLPAPWQSQDVGGPALSGQASYSAGTFSVKGAGVNIWDSADQFRFVYQTLDGDGAIAARVGSLQNTNSLAKAGVMVREDLTGNAPNAFALVTATTGMAFQRRASRGGSTTSSQKFSGDAPEWVRVVRSGNTLSGYYSPDGSAWTLMGTSTITLPTRVYVGLAVTSHDSSLVTTATFSNVAVSSAVSNRAPTLTDPPNQTHAENAAVSLQLTASDPDGNTLTYSATGLPPSLSVNPSTGLIGGTLSFTSAGSYTVTATVSDGTLSNSQTFTWTVTNVNRPPVLTQPPNQSSTANSSVSLQLVASDPDGTALTYSATGLPASLGVNPSTGLIAGTLASASAGSYTVTASASDGALSNTKTFTWVVVAANGAPVLTQPANQTSAVNTSVSLQLQASDPNGSALTYSASGLPPSLSINTGTGRISGTLPATSAGSYHVTATASDGALSSSATFTWTVTDANDRAVEGDYDGDGRADLAVYRNATGIWNILLSSTSAPLSVSLGVAGDVLVPGDYDGDGKTDVAVFKPSSTAVWSILKSSANFAGPSVDVPWGRSGDIPLTADYDGDGRIDLTVFRPSDGTWRILTSGSNFATSVVVTQ